MPLVETLIVILLACVVVILGLGLVNMMRGGSASRSQSLMRMRVLLQFLAIMAALAVLYFSTRS